MSAVHQPSRVELQVRGLSPVLSGCGTKVDPLVPAESRGKLAAMEQAGPGRVEVEVGVGLGRIGRAGKSCALDVEFSGTAVFRDSLCNGGASELGAAAGIDLSSAASSE